jgi:hypothetical protein
MSDSLAPGVHLDRAALAMLAHPLRSRLLAELRVAGPATATTLAAALQTNTGATSYHLRKLAQVALVVDAGDGSGRQRLWSASTESRPRHEGPSDGAHDTDDTGDTDDADAEAALGWLARDYLHHFTDRAEQWLDTQDRWPVAGASRSACQTTWCRSRPDSFQRCVRTWPGSWNVYRRVGAGNPDAKRVSVYVCPLPVRPPARLSSQPPGARRYQQ